MTRRRRLELVVIGAFVFSLPSIALIWSRQGGLTAAIFAASLVVMMVCGLFVARRI